MKLVFCFVTSAASTVLAGLNLDAIGKICEKLWEARELRSGGARCCINFLLNAI